MPLRLHVVMLGRFELWEETSRSRGGDRRALPLPATAKSQSLLAYLLLNRDRRLGREMLAEMFWPGRPRQRARRSLSTALWRIRRCFEPVDVLTSDHQTVQLVFPGPVRIDVEAFETMVQGAVGVTDLQRAVNLYEDRFLPGCYDDWAERERDWLRALYQNALLQLMQVYEIQGDARSALKAALRVLEIDACSEAAHRAAMRAYDHLGQRAAALEQYRRCQKALAQEMNAEVSPATVAQYRALLARKDAPQGLVPPELASPTVAPPPLTRFPSSVAAEDAPPLVGREEELFFLQERWQAAMSGRSCAVFLGGEAGVGKTRLLDALAAAVQRDRGQIIGVRCFEYERSEPYGALVDVLHGAMALGGESVLRELSSWQIANLTRLDPDVHRFLPAEARYMAVVETEQKHLLRALVQLVARVARRGPLLLLLDDLQWAHESTLAWLPALARELPTMPLMLVGAYRIEEVAPSDMLARIITGLVAQQLAERMILSRLSPAHLSEWLRGLDKGFIDRIHFHTEGNPFFVQETMRALVQQGRVEQVDAGYRLREEGFSLPLPESVRQAVAIRMDALTPTARQGLGAAAVIGRMFDLDVWIQAWGVDEDKALEALDELLQGHLLREGTSAFARDYEFEHHLVRETAYQAIPARRRRELHLAAAHTLEALRGGEPGLSAEIAFHYLRAGAALRARPWLLLAGDQAVAATATDEALRFYKRALAEFPEDQAHRFQRAVLERKIGEIHFRRGEYKQAEGHFLQALKLLGRSFPAEGAPLHWAVSASLLHQMAHRLDPISLRKAYLAATPALREEVAVYTSLGWMYSLQSRYEPYLLVSLRALNRSEDARYPRGIAVAATALGIAMDFVTQYGLAERFHRQAQAAASQVEAPDDAGFAAFGQAYHAYLIGDEAAALAQAMLASQKYRQAGDAHRWALAKALQAYVLAYRGQLDEVVAIGQKLIAVGEEMEDAAASCSGEALLALVRRWRGAWDEAMEHYRRAVQLAAAIPDNMNLVEHLAGMARCQLRLENWGEAWQTLRRASEVATIHDVRGDSLSHLTMAKLEASLWAIGHVTNARPEWLARSKDIAGVARKQARTFRPAQPEALRLCGRYEWLSGRPDAARAWWKRSMERARESGHALDWALTAFEMGQRLEMPSLQAQGRAQLELAGAAEEGAFCVR